ncbi:MAG: transporter [Mycobacterium sp.]|nr:transporter [Mycobacterium sp.]
MSSRVSDLGSRPDATRLPSPGATTTRIAITVVFVVHGLLFASWTAHIPHVKQSLGLNDGALGLALVGAPVGSIAAMCLAAMLLPRFGSRRIIQVALCGYCAAGPLVGITGSLTALFGALVLWGVFQGTLDVAMNTQAIAIERRSGRPLMSGLHGGWSIGAFTGAGIGALAVGGGLALTPQLLVLGSVALLVASLLSTRLLPDHRDGSETETPTAETESGDGRSRWSLGMLALATIAFATMLCEGTAANWASVYLSGPLGATGAVPGLGYVGFALAMVTVRLAGNRLLGRFRPDRLLPVLALVATVGFTTALLLDTPLAAIVGFGCLGLGLASVVPAVFSAAGRLPGLHPGTAVATVSAFGWAGFVIGPPVIGHVAALTTLPTALGLLPVLTGFVALGAWFAPGLKGRRTP